MPVADVRESHETLIRAPAEAVLAAAERQDLRSLPLVNALFRLRGALLGAAAGAERRLPSGLVAETRALGWGELSRRPGRELVMGAAAQPWSADPHFTPIPPQAFYAYAEPNRVKIVWTLEAEPLGPALTRFRTQTRALATDGGARRRFRLYWRVFGVGVLLIRHLMLRALKRELEKPGSSGGIAAAPAA
jgi:hypothetical protein